MSGVSELLRSRTKNERLRALRSGRSPKMNEWANGLFFEQIAHSLIFSEKNEQFAQKTDEQIPSPAFFQLHKNLQFIDLKITLLLKFYIFNTKRNLMSLPHSTRKGKILLLKI